MYKLASMCIKRTTDGACIPKDIENTDYREYLKWKAEGGVTDPEFSPEELAANEALAVKNLAIKQTLVDNLPSYNQVQSAIDNIANLADAKAFLKKLAAVVYVYIKNDTV